MKIFHKSMNLIRLQIFLLYVNNLNYFIVSVLKHGILYNW